VGPTSRTDEKPAAQGLPPNAARGRRVAQVVFFATLVWVIVSGSAQILAEGFFAKRVPRDAATCKAELAVLRNKLADASLVTTQGKGELAAVDAFRETLGGEAGRAWDLRAFELVDGCPPEEAAAAYALARLRASHEAMVRIDVREVAPARDAYQKALNSQSPKTP
jgi:hypothetical protein